MTRKLLGLLIFRYNIEISINIFSWWYIFTWYLFWSGSIVNIDSFGRNLCGTGNFSTKWIIKRTLKKLIRLHQSANCVHTKILSSKITTNLKTHLKNKHNEAFLKCNARVSIKLKAFIAKPKTNICYIEKSSTWDCLERVPLSAVIAHGSVPQHYEIAYFNIWTICIYRQYSTFTCMYIVLMCICL